MKSPLALWVAVLSVLSIGCALMPTETRVRVIEHKKEPQGHYSVLFKIVEPTDLASRYYHVATWRADRVRDADGHLYEIGLNFTQVGMLKSSPDFKTRPNNYAALPPTSKDSDFFECARRLD